MLASSPGFSQPAASFFGHWRLGIHLVPFVAFVCATTISFCRSSLVNVLKVMGLGMGGEPPMPKPIDMLSALTAEEWEERDGESPACAGDRPGSGCDLSHRSH